MNKPVGISILTNGNRLEYLKSCLNSFLANCHYRPLHISVFDNGSTDGTAYWLRNPPSIYGVKWQNHTASADMGCAAGTNASITLLKEAKFILHLESDFEHIPSELSGEDKLWLHRAIEFMQGGECDYMYLRHMVNERDIFQHWWSQWMPKIDKTEGNYLRCPGFWWSNNPTLFRAEAMWLTGTLPLDVKKDGAKGTAGWSVPELATPKPTKPWIHKWGLFVHELPMQGDLKRGCKKINGDCKYGFFKDGTDAFCSCCTTQYGFEDMDYHARRFAGK